MAGEVSAVLQLGTYLYKTTRFIEKFARDVNKHGDRLSELVGRIDHHREMIESAYEVCERVKDERDRMVQKRARRILQRVEKIKAAIEELTHVKDNWKHADKSMFRKILENWLNEVEGGKERIEEAMKTIKILEDSILSEKADIVIFLNRPKKDVVLVETNEVDDDSDTEVEDDQHLSQELIAAINSTSLKKVKRRLDAGDSVLLFGYKGHNVFHYAIRAGGRRVLNELLECDPIKNNLWVLNRPDDDGEPPLHLGLELGNIEMMAALLNAGANVNARDRNDFTCLEKALDGPRTDIVELLLSHKADESLFDSDLQRRLDSIKIIRDQRS